MERFTLGELRNYLFHPGRSVSEWDGTESNFDVGLEVEFLIVDISDASKVMRRSHYMHFIDALTKDGPFNLRPPNRKEKFCSASMEMSTGYLKIKPDISYNIIEVALPPFSSSAEVMKIMASTLKLLDRALERVGFKRYPFSNMPRLLFEGEIDLVSNSGVVKHIEVLKKYGYRSPSSPVFAASIAATHIHYRNVGEATFRAFPGISRELEKYQSTFANQGPFIGKVQGNLRQRLYENSLPDNYLLRAFHEKAPNSIDDLHAMYVGSPEVFPEEKTGGVRDLSFLRINSIGTVELRPFGTTTLSSLGELISVTRKLMLNELGRSGCE